MFSRSDQLTDSYTYQWSGPGVVAANANTQNITITAPTAPGVYTYQLTALGQPAYGCDAIATTQITVVPPPVIATTRTLPQVCAGAPVVLTAAASRPTGSGSNLADTYTYQWSGPGGASGTGASFTVRPTTLGINTYTVTATGTPRYGCSATQTVTVEVVPPPVALITPGAASGLRRRPGAADGLDHPSHGLG